MGGREDAAGSGREEGSGVSGVDAAEEDATVEDAVDADATEAK